MTATTTPDASPPAPGVPDLMRSPERPSVWPYVTAAIMLFGALVALRISYRQTAHMEGDRVTAREVSAIAAELETTRAKVEYLESFARSLQRQNREQGRRIEAVESEIQPESPNPE